MRHSDINPDLLNLPPITAREQLLIDAYCRENVSLDYLPYTLAFDRIVASCTSGEPTRLDYRLALTTLQLLKKRGLLPWNNSQYKTESEKAEY